MTTRLWNGGTGWLSTWADWTPSGAVAPGDLLVMQHGLGVVAGHQLAGDTVTMAGDNAASDAGQPSLVALGGAHINVVITDIVNGIDLTDIGQPPVTHPGLAPAVGTVDVIGRDHVNVDVIGQRDVFQASGTVNIAPFSTMTGSVEASNNGVVTVNGGADARFANQASALGENGVATINADMVGSGTFAMTYLSALTLDGSVGRDQTIINDDGSLVLGQPGNFHGLVDWTVDAFAGDFVLLAGAQAQSYAYGHDTLSLFNNGKDVLTLRLDASGGSFAAVQTSGGVELASSGVSVPGTVLPLHRAV